VGFLCPVRAALLEHELVDCEQFVLTTPREPYCLCFVLGDFPYSLSDIALVYVHLSTLGKVDVFRPGVAVVDYKLYWSMPTLVVAAVVDVLVSDIS